MYMYMQLTKRVHVGGKVHVQLYIVHVHIFYTCICRKCSHIYQSEGDLSACLCTLVLNWFTQLLEDWKCM